MVVAPMSGRCRLWHATPTKCCSSISSDRKLCTNCGLVRLVPYILVASPNQASVVKGAGGQCSAGSRISTNNGATMACTGCHLVRIIYEFVIFASAVSDGLPCRWTAAGERHVLVPREKRGLMFYRICCTALSNVSPR